MKLSLKATLLRIHSGPGFVMATNFALSWPRFSGDTMKKVWCAWNPFWMRCATSHQMDYWCSARNFDSRSIPSWFAAFCNEQQTNVHPLSFCVMNSLCTRPDWQQHFKLWIFNFVAMNGLAMQFNTSKTCEKLSKFLNQVMLHNYNPFSRLMYRGHDIQRPALSIITRS